MLNPDILKLISKSILDRIDGESKKHILQASIGRVDFKMDDIPFMRWIIRQEAMMSSQIGVDITGACLPPEEGPKTILDHNCIWRDSKFGEYFLTTGIGTIFLPDNRKLSIDTLSNYIPDLNHIDALDGKIETLEFKFTFNSLIEDLQEIGIITLELERLEEEVKTKSPEEVTTLLERIENLERQRIDLKEKIRKHRVTSAQLRYQPILDKEQEKVKRSQILNGSLIINGGPGTGKTTSLIQRITFLTSETINEYVKLNTEQKKLLFDKNTSWIFFSPSELLREYLKDAMVKEGLPADKLRVQIWNIYRTNIFRQLKLINPETKLPFTHFPSNANFFKPTDINLLNIINEFESYINNYQLAKINKALNIKINQYDWKETGFAITQAIKSITNINKQDWFYFYLNLNENFENKSKLINEEYSKKLKDVAADAQISIKRDNSELLVFLEKELKDLNDKSEKESFDEEDDDFQDESNTDIIEPIYNFELDFNRKLQIWIRKAALIQLDTNTKFTKKEKELYEKVESHIKKEEYFYIGQRAIFKKYFERLLKGYESNLLKEIPSMYKKFRKDVLYKSKYLTKEGKVILNEILSPKLGSAPKNRKIHDDEKDFVIYFIYKYVHQIYNKFPHFFANSKNHYIETLKNSWKSIVAIDEATDFSLLQLACMTYTSHPMFSCVTLSGDLMQRMTSFGLRKWDNYIKLFPNTKIRELRVSYRQTAVLMDIAINLFEKSMGKSANFISNYKYDAIDPRPLLYQGIDFIEKINWISKRIIEIYKWHERSIPTIAIFVKNDSYGKEIQNALNQTEISDYDIRAKACLNGEILGDAETVRIYDIKFIKGMEFEAVFFMDIDDYELADKELLDKYFYVGLSRANFFLAATVNLELPQAIAFIMDKFYQDQDWELIS